MPAPAHPRRAVPAGLAVLVLAALLLAGLPPAGAAATAQSPPSAPSGLLVDLLPEPLAVEDLEGPRLSWVVGDDARGATQSAYQVLVATAADRLTPEAADVWDSGKVRGTSSTSVAYAGPRLDPRTRYHWTVRTWDEDDLAGPFAQPAQFGTAVEDGWEATPIWADAGDAAFPEWTDYRVELDATIHESAATLWFRAADAGNNYMWQLRAGTDELAKHVFAGGGYTLETTPLGFDVIPGTTYRLAVEASGSTIRTWIDGDLVDETTDGTHRRGPIGFRHGGSEQASYDDIVVTAADGTVLLDEDFSAGRGLFPCGTVTDGALRVGRGERCLIEDTDADWRDYTLAFDTVVHENAATAWFRASDADNNFMWQLRAGPDELAKHVWTNGQYDLEVVPLGFDLRPGVRHRVEIEAVGSQIRTSVDGRVIDTTTSGAHPSGTIGFRHGNFEQATYDDIVVTAPSGREVWSEDFSSGANPFPCGTVTDGALRVGRGQRCLLNPGGDDLPGSGDTWAFLRREFSVADRAVASATLYATATSPQPTRQYVFQARLNGAFVGVGPTRGFAGQQPYNAYDVTDLLQPGANALAVQAHTTSGKAFQAQLDIVYVDGTRDVVATGPEWQARSGDRIYLDAGNSGTGYFSAPREYLRADRFPTGFDRPGFDAGAWDSAVTRPAISGLVGLPTRNLEREVRTPVAVEQIGANAYRLDFGRTVVGGLRLQVDGEEGREVDIRLGEERNADGSVRWQMRTGNTYRDRFTLAGGQQTLEHWGYRVFRWAEVANLPDGFDASDIEGIGYIYPFDDDAASFSSSDEDLEEVWEFSRDSIRLLSMDLYMDTPSRERGPYEADAYLHQRSHYALDREFALARYSSEYLYSNPTWPTEWKLTSPTAAWTDYLHTGDERSLARWYDLLKTKSVRGFMDDRGLVVKDPGGAHDPSAWTDIIDWPTSLRDGYVFTDVNTVINTYNVKSLRSLASIAQVLGRQDDAATFTALADRNAEAINTRLFDAERGRYRDGLGVDHFAAHASIYPLAFDVASEETAEPAAAYIAERGIVGNIFSAAFQVEALFEHGRADDAVDLLTSDARNSWRNMIRLGAGTTMETWDPALKSNTTYSHPAGGSPAYLLPEGMFGISPLEPAFRRFSVAPRPGGVDRAAVRVPTMSGTIEAAFDRDGEALELDLTVPANTVAELRLPAEEQWQVTEGGRLARRAEGVRFLEMRDGDAVFEVGAGSYAFRTDPDRPVPPCPEPDERPTVVVGAVDSGVPNRELPDDCRINDLIRDEDDWANHGLFVRHVTEVLGRLAGMGLVDDAERGAIASAAARSGVGGR